MGIFDRFRSVGPAAVDSRSVKDKSEQDALRLIEAGNALQISNQIDAALQHYLEAIRLAPKLARAHLSHGNILLFKDDVNGAIAAYENAIKLKPDYADAYFNIGCVLLNSGQFDAAAAKFRCALEVKPDMFEASFNLGAALQAQGMLTEAEAIFRRTLEIEPNLFDAHLNLGVVLEKLGQPEKSVASYRRALEINPESAEAHYNLGVILRSMGQLENAMDCYRRAISIRPDFAEAHNNLGLILHYLGQYQNAMACYRHALILNPDLAQAHSNLGQVLQELGEFEYAFASFNRALEIDPTLIEAHLNLGVALQKHGQLENAIARYQRALEIKPDYAEAHSNLLYTMNFAADLQPDVYLSLAQHYGRILSGMVTARFSDWHCSAQPTRLRVGLVSGDLRTHSVGHFLEGLLALIDPGRIELYAYPTQHNEDALTARIRPYFSAWKPLTGKSDEAAARLIHDDGVHVLLDLSGHTAHNRLPVFAWKPAPVQATWLGLPTTTGVQEIDYVLGDSVAIPPEIDDQFSENIWRLPDCYVCFSAPQYPLAVAALPALATGHVTFGSFNNLTKMNDAVVEVWARILAATPNSRLYLKTGQLSVADMHELTRQRFAAHGIAPERLLLSGHKGSISDHLAEYDRVDVALDTFPYPGVTTSVEALWMGVPVLSLHGDRFLSLSAKSIAYHAGLPDWVAASKDDYVAKAVAFSADLESLSELRTRLRQQVVASPVFDTPRFARNLEEVLWGMWRARQISSQP